MPGAATSRRAPNRCVAQHPQYWSGRPSSRTAAPGTPAFAAKHPGESHSCSRCADRHQPRRRADAPGTGSRRCTAPRGAVDGSVRLADRCAGCATGRAPLGWGCYEARGPGSAAVCREGSAYENICRTKADGQTCFGGSFYHVGAVGVAGSRLWRTALPPRKNLPPACAGVRCVGSLLLASEKGRAARLR